MLTIRQDQIEIFRQVALSEFEHRMLEHIGKFFPRQIETLGETGMRELIRHGIKRAEGYGIIAERDVCKYIDVSVVFGREFDTDSRTSWASTILRDSALTSPTDRINRLFELATRNVGR